MDNYHEDDDSEYYYSYERFFFAIQSNNLAQLKLLAETPHGLSKLSDYGYSLLKEACKRNMTETVEFLLSKNCDVNRTDSLNEHNPPLHYAIISGNMKVVELLLKRGARVNISDDNENTVLANLLNAIENAEDGILECFIHYGFPQNDFTKGCTPLHLAAFHGDMEILEKFLAKDGACDAKTLNGMTPNHFACYKGHLDIVERLIEQGACVNELAECGLIPVSTVDFEYSKFCYRCSPLHIAIANEHFSLVKLLLDHGANVNAQYVHGETVLYLASEISYEMTKLLLSYCPDVNDSGNKRALTNAILNQLDLNTVRCLFEYGFTIEPEYVKNKRFLKAVCKLGCVEAMKNLIRDGLDVNTKTNFLGGSLLHLVVKNRKRDLCEYLLDCKANVNNKDKKYKTPFFYAVRNGDVEIAKLLLNNGAERTEDISDALRTAVCNQKLEIVEFVVETYGNIKEILFEYLLSILLDLERYSKLHEDDVFLANITKLLLKETVTDKGFRVDSLIYLLYFDAVTILVCAVMKGYNNVVEVLLNHGANVNFQATNGLSVLHFAVTHGCKDIINLLKRPDAFDLIEFKASTSNKGAEKDYKDIVELLLKYGSDCRLLDSSGRTALHLAVLHNNQEVIKVLLKSGSNITLQDKFGQTPLHIACKNDFDENVRLLLECNLNVKYPLNETFVDLLNLKNMKGLTPLIIASINGCRKIVEILLNYGVNVNTQDIDGATALHHAVIKNSVDIVELLIKYGIDFNLQDSKHRTALKLAVNIKNLKAIEMLIKAGCNYKFQDSSGGTILHLACERNEDRTVRVIVTSIRSVNDDSDQTFIDFLNMKDNGGFSALIIASTRGSLEIVEILLNSGADVNSENFCGETALRRAVRNNNRTMVSILLKFGSDVNRTSADGHTALTYCVPRSVCFGSSKPHFPDINMSFKLIKILENHVTKLMAAGFYICEKNARHMKHRFINPYTRNHEIISPGDCLYELDISKKCFPYKNISMYDIITASIDKLLKYLRNEELVESLDSYEYANQFPIYADFIFGRFKIAKRRKHLREKFEKFYFNCVNCDFSRLPYVCIEEIISNLSDDDLRAFTDAIGHLC